MTDTALIALDWGTSSFRAYRMAADGTILEARRAARGILHVPDRDFAREFLAEVGDWLGAAEAPAPVIASGMITSRQGWVETPYVDCPATPEAIAAGLVAHRVPRENAPDATVHFVPGARMPEGAAGTLGGRTAGIRDVMRGEETEILGGFGGGSGLGILPGTHSKWARIEGGGIAGFASFLTGEIYGALLEHTILGRLSTPAAGGDASASPAFAEGVAAGADAARAGLVTHAVFAARTRGLSGDLSGEDVAPWLSGYLIGAEIEGGRRACGLEAGGSVTLLGSASLLAAYERALGSLGFSPRRGPPDAAARGLHAVARARGMIG